MLMFYMALLDTDEERLKISDIYHNYRFQQLLCEQQGDCGTNCRPR